MRLRSQNSLLTNLLDGERLKLDHARDDLLQRVAGLLGDFTSEREKSMRDAFGELEHGNLAAEPDLMTFGEEQRIRVDEVVSKGNQWSVGLERKSSELKRSRDAALKVHIFSIYPAFLCSPKATLVGTDVFKCYIARWVRQSAAIYHDIYYVVHERTRCRSTGPQRIIRGCRGCIRTR